MPWLAVVPVLLGGSGCLSANYRPAAKETPAIALHLTAAHPPAEGEVRSVIVLQGPGSWKREAYWDEYVVCVVNRGETPLSFEQATLEDFQGGANQPGTDPWQLENQTKTWWEKTKSSQVGNLVALGAGAVGIAGALAGVSLGISGILGPATATSTALAGAATATLVAAPIYAVGVVVVNAQNKQEIEAEFAKRRLSLPAIVAPGKSVQGSLFFRISPGPQRLTLHCRAANEAHDVTVDLAPVARLHLKSTTDPTASQD
jgi:hypothetical protein